MGANRPKQNRLFVTIGGPRFRGSNADGDAKKTGWGCSRPWQRGLPHAKGDNWVFADWQQGLPCIAESTSASEPFGFHGDSGGFDFRGMSLEGAAFRGGGMGRTALVCNGRGLPASAGGVRGQGDRGLPSLVWVSASSRIVTGPRFRIPAPRDSIQANSRPRPVTVLFFLSSRMKIGSMKLKHVNGRTMQR